MPDDVRRPELGLVYLFHLAHDVDRDGQGAGPDADDDGARARLADAEGGAHVEEEAEIEGRHRPALPREDAGGARGRVGDADPRARAEDLDDPAGVERGLGVVDPHGDQSDHWLLSAPGKVRWRDSAAHGSRGVAIVLEGAQEPEVIGETRAAPRGGRAAAEVIRSSHVHRRRAGAGSHCPDRR